MVKAMVAQRQYQANAMVTDLIFTKRIHWLCTYIMQFFKSSSINITFNSVNKKLL